MGWHKIKELNTNKSRGTNIFKLISAYKDYIWGGSKLKSGYGKDSDLDIVAESWELSTHGDGLSIIANGEGAGKSLREYVRINQGDEYI